MLTGRRNEILKCLTYLELRRKELNHIDKEIKDAIDHLIGRCFRRNNGDRHGVVGGAQVQRQAPEPDREAGEGSFDESLNHCKSYFRIYSSIEPFNSTTVALQQEFNSIVFV